MLCPKCKTEMTVKRINKVAVFVCRNPSCPNHNKPVKAQQDSK